MKGYLLFGAARNLFGILLLTYLTYLGLSVTVALLIVVSVGFTLYITQVQLFVGKVNFRIIIMMFIFIYFANRILLWVIHEKFGSPIYIAQIVSILSLSMGSYFVLKISYLRKYKLRDTVL